MTEPLWLFRSEQNQESRAAHVGPTSLSRQKFRGRSAVCHWLEAGGSRIELLLLKVISNIIIVKWSPDGEQLDWPFNMGLSPDRLNTSIRLLVLE